MSRYQPPSMSIGPSGPAPARNLAQDTKGHHMEKGKPNRWSRSLKLGVSAVLIAPLLTGVGATRALAKDAGVSTSDSSSPGVSPVQGVQAILLDSYSGCSVTDAWSTINAQWQQYGSVPVVISTGGRLCQGHFTLSDLEASGADTVILADTAWLYQLTTEEITALQEYASEGHTLLGVAVDFSMRRHDDNALAPLFGLAEQAQWRLAQFRDGVPTYKLRLKNPASPVLFRDVADPYVSGNAPFGEKPGDRHWSSNDLSGASIIGDNKHGHAVITIYKAANYAAIYIANEADGSSTHDDLQFLYNSLVYPMQG